MKKVLFSLSLLLSSSYVYADTISKNCIFNGKPLNGRVKVVKQLPDFKVKVVQQLEDIKVKRVSSSPDSCGQWQFVDSFPDFTIEYVNSFPDFTIKFVDSFQGIP